MENISYSKTIRGQWEVIALIAGIAVVLSLLISIIQPFKYRASTQLLIIQKQASNLDAYTATKSAEKIGKNLATIVYTSSVYNDVINANPEIKAHFPSDEVERRKTWQKNIDASVIPETGILYIASYDEDKAFAASLVRVIAHTLVNKGADYHGGGTGVEIKIVDDVVTSTYPVRPNIILHTIVALMLGTIAGMAFVVLKASARAERVRETADAHGEHMTRTVSADESAPAPAPTTDRGWYFAEEQPTPAESADQPIPLYNSIKTMHDHLAR